MTLTPAQLFVLLVSIYGRGKHSVKKIGHFRVEIMNANIAGVPYAIGVNNHMGSRFTSCRNIFLDNIVEESAIIYQLFKLRQHALIYGRAVGIGHPYPETAQAINKFVNKMNDRHLSFVYASEIL